MLALAKITNSFVRNYFAEKKLDLLMLEEDRPWGGYYVYEETPEYDKKVLWVKPGLALSLQYHGTPIHPGHNEVCTGITKFKLFLGDINVVGKTETEVAQAALAVDVIEVKEGMSMTMPAGHIHAYANPYEHDVYLLEIRTSQVPEDSNARETNIVRIFDQAQRNGLSQYPQELFAKAFSESR